MKYRVVKAFKDWKVGETFVERYYSFDADELIGLGIFEKVEEKKKPKFKVGDKVVFEFKRDIHYIKIWKISYFDCKFYYDGKEEFSLREPTKEELELYFR